MEKVNLDSLRFNLTEEMNNIFIELIITKQLLDDSMRKDTKITDEERWSLYYHYTELRAKFIYNFKKRNKAQIKKYNEFINK